MKQLIPFITALVLLVSCGPSPQELASERLETAKELLQDKKFNEAKLIIDSLERVFPDQYEIIAQGQKLLGKVEIIEQQKSLIYYDSLLLLQERDFQELKKHFVYKAGNPGQYTHKRQQVSNSYDRSYIQAHVDDQGKFYISSRFHGKKNIHHHSIKVYNEGLFAETSIIPKGLDNRSFDDGGEVWETVNYRNGTDNGVVSFIVNNSDQRLKVMYKCKNPYYIVMEQYDKDAVRMAYDMGQIILSMKQLKNDLAITKKRVDVLKQQIGL